MRYSGENLAFTFINFLRIELTIIQKIDILKTDL